MVGPFLESSQEMVTAYTTPFATRRLLVPRQRGEERLERAPFTVGRSSMNEQ